MIEIKRVKRYLKKLGITARVMRLNEEEYVVYLGSKNLNQPTYKPVFENTPKISELLELTKKDYKDIDRWQEEYLELDVLEISQKMLSWLEDRGLTLKDGKTKLRMRTFLRKGREWKKEKGFDSDPDEVFKREYRQEQLRKSK